MFQPDRAELFLCHNGFSSSDANLTSFVTDNTWDDHVILHGAAIQTCIDMSNSPPRHYDVMTCSKRLVLGHAHELHVHKIRLHLV